MLIADISNQSQHPFQLSPDEASKSFAIEISQQINQSWNMYENKFAILILGDGLP